jgi:hypothetical protein
VLADELAHDDRFRRRFVAVGLAIDVTISVARVHTADHIDPVAVQALSSLYSNDFIPFVLGAMLILLASGLAIVRQDNLPRWLGGWASRWRFPPPRPLGAITFLGAGIWILLAYVLLWTRRRGLSRLETDRRRIAGRVCDPDSGAVA